VSAYGALPAADRDYLTGLLAERRQALRDALRRLPRAAGLARTRVEVEEDRLSRVIAALRADAPQIYGQEVRA